MLEQLAPDLYEAQRVLRMPGGALLPARMTVVRRGDELALISPIDIDDALAAQLEALGRVRYLIAPNAFHHLFLRPAMERFGEVKVSGVPAVIAKRANVRFDEVIDAGCESVADGMLEARLIEGVPRFDEAVFFHRPSLSLLVTDLVFHVVTPANARIKAVMWLMGTSGRLAQSRAWGLFGKDRAAALRSMERVWEWPFERLVPAHGDVVEEDARARLKAALRWTA